MIKLIKLFLRNKQINRIKDEEYFESKFSMFLL